MCVYLRMWGGDSVVGIATMLWDGRSGDSNPEGQGIFSVP